MTHDRSSVRLVLVVFVALLLLLTLTVAAARHDLGQWNFPIAAAIASVKALLIVLYFMHVRQSVPLTRLVVVAGLLWLAILFTLSLTDYWTRNWLS
jgi:cytochrome c oxidase subunit 4